MFTVGGERGARAAVEGGEGKGGLEGSKVKVEKGEGKGREGSSTNPHHPPPPTLTASKDQPRHWNAKKDLEGLPSFSQCAEEDVKKGVK